MCSPICSSAHGARGAAFAHTTVHGDWGVRFPAGPRISVHAVVAGEAHLWADAPEQALRLVPGDIVLVRESHAAPDGPRARGAVHRLRRPAARPHRAASRHRGRRPGDRVLLRRLRLRGRSRSLDARLAARDLPAAPGAGEHPARHDGPARARDAARRARPAGAARPPARRRAGAGAARALHGARRRTRRPGFAPPATPTSAPRCAPCTPTRRARGRSPTSPPRRRCRARPSRGASPSCSARRRSPT